MLPDWRELHAALLALHRNEKPEGLVRANLLAYGLISEETQEKRCGRCGSPQVDFRYDKITPGGRLFMAVAAGRRADQAAVFELGYKACERGDNIQKALIDFEAVSS